MNANAPAPRSSVNVETTIFGLLVSLTLKVALDTAYGNTLVAATSEAELRRAVGVPRSWLLLVFVFTLMRFIYGSYRINDEVQNSPVDEGALPRFWNLVATLVLFVFFYATGLSIRHAGPFFTNMMAVHGWDFVWLLTTMALTPQIAGLRGVMWRFLVIDVLTVLALALSIRLTGTVHRDVAVALMLVLGLADFAWNSDFFFRPNKWRNSAAPAPDAAPTKVAAAAAVESKRPRVYFAAPLFTQGEWQWNARLAEGLRGLGVEVLLPQQTAAPMLSGAEAFDPAKLFNLNVEDITRAGVVLAVLDQPDPDSGTCWECGYAYRAGYPVIGLRTDIRPSGDDPGRPVNLMLARSCSEFVSVPLDKRDDVEWVARQVHAKLAALNPAP